MFNHSVKVPRLYKNASKIAKEVSEGKGSIKQLVYESKHTNIKGLYALIVHAFERTVEIEKLLKKSKLLINEPRFDPWLAKILITELLWGKKRLTGDSKPVKTILGYEQVFKAHMSDISDDRVEVRQVEKPRYVRVNSLKITVNEAVEKFIEEGWVLKRYTDVNNYFGFLEAVSNLSSEEFMVDLHIPYLLIFPPKTQFYQHPAYKKGSIILQDKASCLPVHILNPQRGATIMDMCAAPGMKTTQTAAAIENEGVIYAVEIGTKRYNTLTKIVESSGATCVKPINRDVLTMTGNDCPNVEYIIVDPSCSGSGLTDRIEIGQQKQDEDKARLSKLAGFQIKILRHALTRFPKVKTVVYSTCSVYPEENEDVVRQVLETCTRFKLVPANEFVKNAWLNYGSPEFGDIGNYCLYAKPDIDLTSGFFVAVFERLKKGECNQFLNANLFPSQSHVEKKRKILERYLDANAQEENTKKYNEDQCNDTEELNQPITDYEEIQTDESPKKRKKKKIQDDDDGENRVQLLKKIKIEKNVAETNSSDEIAVKNESSNVKQKKKKHKYKDEENVSKVEVKEDPDIKIKKKKHKQGLEVQNEDKQEISRAGIDTRKIFDNRANEDGVAEAKISNKNSSVKQMKRKEREENEDGLNIQCDIDESNQKKRKKKKHKCKDEPQSCDDIEDSGVKVKKNKHKEEEQELNEPQIYKKKKTKKSEKL